MTTEVKYEPTDGETILAASEKAVRIARAAGEAVTLSINGDSITVVPSDDPKEVFDRYRRAEENERRRVMFQAVRDSVAEFDDAQWVNGAKVSQSIKSMSTPHLLNALRRAERGDGFGNNDESVYEALVFEAYYRRGLRDW